MNTKENILIEQTATDALEKFKIGMTQLSTAMKASGGSAPSKAAAAPTGGVPTDVTKEPGPTTAAQPTTAKQPASSVSTGGPTKEVGTADLSKKVAELGIEPDKAVKLLQYYGIKVVKQ